MAKCNQLTPVPFKGLRGVHTGFAFTHDVVCVGHVHITDFNVAMRLSRHTDLITSVSGTKPYMGRSDKIGYFMFNGTVSGLDDII